MGKNFTHRNVLVIVALFLSCAYSAQQRVTQDLVAYFTFSEGGGKYIADNSGFGEPMILKIYDESHVQWLEGGGLAALNPVLVKSLNNASKVEAACSVSNEITLEVWLKSDNASQDGPARIFSMGHGTSERNFMLGQNLSKYLARSRTTTTSVNGTPNLESPNSSVGSNIQHLVYTKDASGVEKLYLNGAVVSSSVRTGAFTNWNSNFELSLFNEISADRPWLGEMHLAAIYSSALTIAEVGQNYSAGHQQSGPALSAEECTNLDCFVDGYGTSQRSLWIASLPAPVGQEYHFGPDGGGFDVFEDGTAHLYGEVWNSSDEEYGWYIDVWLQDAMNWEDWSALGRSWKGTASIVGNLYTTWTYYIMNPNAANVLIGLGEFEGSSLSLTHKPANYQYGFQLGVGANDKNALPGMSCWFDFSGNIGEDVVNGNGDFNLEGECDNLPAFQCAVDVEVNCDEGFLPELTGYPQMNCPSEYALSYTDELIGSSCPLLYARNWTVWNTVGDSLVCEQLITLIDEEAPVISPGSGIISGCNIEAEIESFVSDNCSDIVDISYTISDTTWVSSLECEPGMFRTQTQGGWGAAPNGNNPGAYLHEHFGEVFPNGISLGCDNTLVLLTAQDVTNFLPSGSSPAVFPSGSLVNPGSAYSNVFAGQLVALTISLAMDSSIPEFGSSNLALSDLIVIGESLEGWAVGEVWQLANEVIGGCNTNYTPAELVQVLSSINENFVDGTINQGYLDCSIPADCFTLFDLTINATDMCGNTSVWNGELMWVDSIAPIFPYMPTQIAVSCGEVPPTEIFWSEECFEAAIELTVVDVLFSGSCLPTIQRTYTATDFCGNQSVFVQFIAVIDTIAPVFLNLPLDVNLECSEDYPDFWPEVVDNCDEAPLVTYNETNEDSGCDLTITRTWTATDDCGNISSVQQIITISDQTAPSFVNAVPQVALACLAQQIALPEVSDFCGTVDLSYTDSQSGSGCSAQIIRTYVATDLCGNQSMFVQTISVLDQTSPLFEYIPQNLVLTCGDSPPSTSLSATDNCGEVNVSLLEITTTIPGECAQLERTWTATDACGNTTIVSQTIQFIDNTTPVFAQLPANVQVSCGGIPEIPSMTASDNCDTEVTIMYEENLAISECLTILTRTWLALDNCGNAAFHNQVITVSDNQAPIITGDSLVNWYCDELGELTVNVTDDCSANPTLSYTDIIVGSGCQYNMERTWTATDQCGNTSEFAQTISITDNQDPEVSSIPQNLTLPCGMSPVMEEPHFTDNCDDQLEIEYTETNTGTGCNVTLTREWIVTDDCGNNIIVVQTIVFVDTQPPIITGVPENLLFECDSFPSFIPVADVTASDVCAGVLTVLFSEVAVPGDCPQEFSILRTWLAEDNCGNSVVAIQVILVADMTPPVFTDEPGDLQVDCDNIPEPIIIGATDNCDADVLVTMQESMPGGGCPIIVRTWIAVDDCGNSNEYVQTIYLVDNEPPILVGIPPVGDVNCNSIPPMPEPDASDNCDQNVSVTASQSIVGGGCQYTIIRTWIAEDDCGNSTIVSQSFNVHDTSAPIFVDLQPELTVECADLQTLPMPAIDDDCGNDVALFYLDQILGSGCNFDILRTYIAQDLCGNSVQAEQLIHVVDNEGPIFLNLPVSGAVSCDAIPEPPLVIANDPCSGNVEVVFSENVIGGGCYYQIIRTWTASDICGNTSDAIQILFVSDGQAPTFTNVPQNISLGCNDFVPPSDIPVVSDNCLVSNIVIEFEETEVETECGYQIMRTWSASDYCGNVSSAFQIISVEDSTAPQFDFIPAEMFISCEQSQMLPFAEASDECGNAQVFFVDETVVGDCPYLVQRTWIAVDDCGNASDAIQNLWVSDNEAPSIVGSISDIEIECNELAPYPILSAQDNCSGELTLDLSESFNDNGCTQTVHRIWTATDLCGNVSTAEQWVTILDTQAPQAFIQSEIFLECHQMPFQIDPEVTDCSEYTVEYLEHSLPTECESEYDVLKTWILTDACGNEGIISQTVHVFDVTPPVLSAEPENVSVTCYEIPPVAEVAASDNCDAEVDVDFLEEVRLISGNDSTCFLSNSVSSAGDLVVWLPGLGGYSTEYIFGEAGGILVQNFSDGTAHLTGQVYAPGMPEQSWIMDVHLRERRNWEEWSALGRSYKDDLNLAGDQFLDWTYYEMDESSILMGAGLFEGSVLNLSHAPANFYFGFQIGFAANNRNADFGMSGWLFYSGEVNGIELSGPGDILTNNSCCPVEEITRTWTATDCAGNATTYTQVITVGEEVLLPLINPFEALGRSSFEVQDGNRDFFVLNYHMFFDEQVVIEMYSQSGQLLRRVFDGSAERNTKYMISMPKTGLADGLYYFTLRGDSGMKSDRGIVMR